MFREVSNLWMENNGEICQKGQQMSNRYLEEVVNPVLPLETIVKS